MRRELPPVLKDHRQRMRQQEAASLQIASYAPGLAAAEKEADTTTTVAAVTPPSVLLLPDWHNCSPAHWLSQWERLHGYQRLTQQNWNVAHRADWYWQLEDYVASSRNQHLALVGCGLGANLIAEWAARSTHAKKIIAAMLVVPMDLERSRIQTIKNCGWLPATRQRLPFPSVLVSSRNDPHCLSVRARGLAFDLGAKYLDVGEAGHMDVDALLGSWEQGHQWFNELLLSAGVQIVTP